MDARPIVLTATERQYLRAACGMQVADIQHDLQHGGEHGHVRPDMGRHDTRRDLVRVYEDLKNKLSD